MRDLDCIGRHMHWLALGTLVATGLALAIKPAHAGCEGGVGQGNLSPGCVTVEAEKVAKRASNACFHGRWFSADAWRACTPGARFADDFAIGVHQSLTFFDCSHPEAPQHRELWRALCHGQRIGPVPMHDGNAGAEASLSRCFNTLQRSAELNAAQHRSGTHWFSARSLGLPRCN